MVDRLLFPLTLLAAIGSGLVAGVFFAFSVFVMKALAQLPPAQGMAAMQSINVVILRTLFMPVFMGTAAICLFTGSGAIMNWNEPFAKYVLAGSLLYFLFTFMVTVAFNVPMNDALAAAKPDSESIALWQRYVTKWTLWNHVRAVGATAALIAFILAAIRINASN